MKLKKILAIVMAAMMVAVFAAGCGSSQPAADNGGDAAPAQSGAAAPIAPAADLGVNDGTGSVLRVAMECAYAPYNWTQTDDSNGAVPIKDSADYAFGYDIMMAKYIAEQLGMELEIYKLDWDSLPMAVQAGTIDCVIAGQSITSERMESVDFSDPYYYASIVTLTTKDSPYAQAKSLEELKGAKCTSQINTIWYDLCLPQIPEADIQPAMEVTAQMLVALDAGSVNVVVTDEPTAMAACAAYDNMVMLDFSNGKDYEVSDEEINIGISMMKGNSGLCSAINGVLATLTEQDYKDWMQEAIAKQPLSTAE
ncbi:MAG: transporter substrate-binding domain-containing protein [Parasporobacterium sp.]|nr:transporter substrate-binding domain-containing protein [Parasporobacterium sp.]